MRFRSGTLERSVKRWGPRMPRMGKLQRVTHSWKYVELNNQAVARGNEVATDIVLCDNQDWSLSGTGLGVKNMTVDLCCGLTWTPTTDAKNVFLGAALRWGLFCMDTDDVPGSTVETPFAAARALRWGSFFRTFNGIELTAADGVWSQPMTATSINWRVRAKQRYMKFEDELRLFAGCSTDVQTVMSDLRLWVFGRVSWETP